MGEEMPDVPMPGWKDRKPSKVKGFGLHKAVWKHVFLTHLHSDHTIGLPSLILSPWSWRREEPPHIYGPPGTNDGQVLIFLSNLRTVPRARLSC